MSDLEPLIDDLVAANRILTREGIVDALGHVSARHPHDTGRYLLSRSRSPQAVEAADIMEFTLEGDAVDRSGRKPYLERFIHGAIYQTRPEVMSVVHSHSHSVIPFSVTSEKLRPIMHGAASIGPEVPVWDPRDCFGDTNLLVVNMAMARDLARTLGQGPSALMRGHGSVVAGASVRAAVEIAIFLELNARLQMSALQLGAITFLSPGEIQACAPFLKNLGGGSDRIWEYWCQRANIPFRSSA